MIRRTPWFGLLLGAAGCAGVQQNPCLQTPEVGSDGAHWRALRKAPRSADALLAQLPIPTRSVRYDWYVGDGGTVRVYVGDDISNDYYDFAQRDGRWALIHSSEPGGLQRLCIHD